MKKILLGAAVALSVIAMNGGAWAGTDITGNNTIGVNATVNGICVMSSDNSALAFPTLDPTAGGTIATNNSGNTKVKCTNGKSFTVTAVSAYQGGSAADCTGAGITGTLSTDALKTHTMDYTFKCAAGTGNGFGNGSPIDINPRATIDMGATANKDAYVGLYADTVTLTITY